jgi:tRNA (cytidine/uridine-2'-O-)-methyltransferase
MFQPDDWLLFGSESSGLPGHALGECDTVLFVPLSCAAVRSLNLSNAVAVVLFEALRKIQKPVQD